MSKKNPQAGDVFFNKRGVPGWPVMVMSGKDGELFSVYFHFPTGPGDKTTDWYRSSKDDTDIPELQNDERWVYLFNISGVELENLILDNWKKGVYDNVPQD